MSAAAQVLDPAHTARQTPPADRTFAPPGPGSWELDTEHCERPHSRWVADVLPPLYTEAFRAGMARYGALLDTLEMKMVHGFAYTAARPVGAPPEAKGTPPRFVFKLLLRLHPALRARIRRTEEVFRTRLWLDDTRTFFEQTMPRCVAELERLQAVPLDAFDDDALLRHLDEVQAQVHGQMHDHFLCAAAGMLPVGDFLVQVRDWTGCAFEEAVGTLAGHSPWSVEGMDGMDALARALRADPEARRILDAGDGAEVLAGLEAHGGAVGDALARWLGRVGQRTLTGHDVAELRGIELPGALVRALRAYMSRPPREAVGAQADEAAARLRARVPEAHRAAFDTLLADARTVYPMRDGHSMIDFWAIGVMRRALLEAGRRLEARGRLHAADHVVDLTPGEIASLLRGERGPSADELLAHVTWRTTRSMADAPLNLGPEPGAPPPAEWLPGASRRAARAMGAFIEMMFTAKGAAKKSVVSGTPASPGRHVGTARLVLTPQDFEKVRPGDVLVARITTPSYNVLLPLLGGVVTDRGGLLSHPAIVSREYGIPGVVGAKDATTRIPDGALVEIDGGAGTVKVIA